MNLKVEAACLATEIKFKRGETSEAYMELNEKILPYALEHGTKKFRLKVLVLLGKVSMKIANQAEQVAPPAASENEEMKEESGT